MNDLPKPIDTPSTLAAAAQLACLLKPALAQALERASADWLTELLRGSTVPQARARQRAAEFTRAWQLAQDDESAGTVRTPDASYFLG